MAGSLSVEAQEHYRLIRDLLVADVPPPARLVDLDAASGTASPCWPTRTSMLSLGLSGGWRRRSSSATVPGSR